MLCLLFLPWATVWTVGSHLYFYIIELSNKVGGSKQYKSVLRSSTGETSFIFAVFCTVFIQHVQKQKAQYKIFASDDMDSPTFFFNSKVIFQ